MLTPSSAATKRVLERLETLFEIGGGAGANRPGLSDREQAACDLVAGWMREAGLEISWDRVGNLLGRLPGTRTELPEVWIGSHLDSVPEGGRYDGALGVVGGLEAVAAAAAAEPLERTVAVVAFRDEEGWRFGTGCFGSRAACDALEPGELERRDAEGVSRQEALVRLGPASAATWRLPAAYLELHVEQGSRLAGADVPVGLVTAIAGLARGEAVFEGERGHAGTTPMAGRRDALRAATLFVLALADTAESIEDAVATAGSITIEPGAGNVIPHRVAVSVDARAPDRARFADLVGTIERAAADGDGDLSLSRKEPVAFEGVALEALRQEVGARGVPVLELASGAGHDAGILAAAGIPSAMLFVRSLAGGVSHAPEEHSSAEDVALALDVLTGALRRLAGD